MIIEWTVSLRKSNSESWSFANYLANVGVKTKAKYIANMIKLKSSENVKDYKQKIGRLFGVYYAGEEIHTRRVMSGRFL